MRKNTRSTFGTNQAIRNSPPKTGIIIDFGVLCNAITFGESIFLWSKFRWIWIEKRTFWCVLLCIYLRRVDFSVVQFLLEFRQQFIDFGMLFDAFTFGVSIFCGWISARNLDEKSSILAWFLMHLPSACRFSRVRNDVESMLGISNWGSEPHQIEKTTKMNANT